MFRFGIADPQADPAQPEAAADTPGAAADQIGAEEVLESEVSHAVAGNG